MSSAAPLVSSFRSVNYSEPVHGRYTTYNNHKCRCKDCTADYARYMRDRRRRLKGSINDSDLMNARHAAERELARRYPGVFKKLYDEEIRKRGITLNEPGRPS